MPFVIPEVCGLRQDCRNVLSVPRERLEQPDGFWAGWLRNATQRRQLYPVDRSNVSLYVPRCCVPGGWCCKMDTDAVARGGATPFEAGYQRTSMCCTSRGLSLYTNAHNEQIAHNESYLREWIRSQKHRIAS